MTAHPETVTPDAAVPATSSSEGAKPHHHAMAQGQGGAYTTAAEHMLTKIAQVGVQAHAGDMIVAVAVEEAEGMYTWQDGRLQWTEPSDENVHIEVVARDAADQRFIPGLSVEVTVKDDSGDTVASGTLPFLWHPWLYHYGSNFELPGTGTYTIDVHIDPPVFGRHDKENGNRYTEPIDVSFADVSIETGQE